MNVLYISYDGMTDPLGQSQVIPYLCGLSKRGYKISLVSCEKKDRYQKNKEHIGQLLSSNNISWHPVPYSSLPSVLSKQLNLRQMQSRANEICEDEKPLIVHCRSYMAALIGLKLKRMFGIKFIFDMRGFWADERIDGGIWNMENFIQKKLYHFFKKKEIQFLLNADFTISLTNNAREEMLSWEKLKDKQIPVQVIPCCADLEHFSADKIDKAKKNILRTELGIHSNDLVVSYLGSIGTWYMLDEMLNFFKRLSDQHSNAKFLLITPDDPQQIIEKAKQKNIPSRSIIIRFAERKQVPLLLSLSSFSLYFIKPLYSKKASSPTKTAEIMGLGIPLVTNSGIGDSDSIIKESAAGLLINEFSNAEYDRIIAQIDVLLRMDKNRIIQAAKDYFSLEKGVELYTLVYEKVLNK